MRIKLPVVAGLFIFHCLVSMVMSAIAHSSFMDAYHNGQGLWNFAMDSFQYHDLGFDSYRQLGNEGYLAWWNAPSFRHTKFIGLVYHLIYPAPLSFAPLSSIAWSASVVSVYLIAMIIYKGDRKLSLVTALLFGLWPSNLLMGTQLLRDPFYNLGIVMMVLGWIAMLSGQRRITHSLLAALGLILSIGIRPEPFWLLVLVSFFAIIMIALRDRQTLPYAMLALLITAMFYGYPAMTAHATEKGDKRIAEVKERLKDEMGMAYTEELDARISKWFQVAWFSPWKDFESKNERLHALALEHGPNLNAFLAKWMTPWEYSRWLPRQVESLGVEANKYRNGFLVWYLAPGTSLVDSDVQFKNINDIIVYIPRAMVIGIFAPFPNQWFAAGKTGGKAIRALGGMEMIAIYFLMIGFVAFLLTSSASLRVKVWFVLFVITMVLPLGLFVPNIGTLFRMRFIYMIPILIGGVEGIKILLEACKQKLALGTSRQKG